MAEVPQATSSHMMKTTKRGRPFLKDTLDLFATLVVSLELTVHKQFFKTFPNSFTTDEAAQNLASLKFSQSNRGPDPRDPSRIVTTTTTTTFSMTREMAKAMCQHFMDARLIENAADKTSNIFRERGVFVVTPKGLHVLERFISKNGISADTLSQVFSSQPICLKLLHLERRASDDEIIISQSVVTALFRRFAGRTMNYMDVTNPNMDPSQEYHERSKGIPLMDVTERVPSVLGKTQTQVFKYCFQAVTALEWLCDFTSIVGRDEAAEMAAHFVRFGLIALVSDKRKGNDSAIIFTVRGSAPTGNSTVTQQGEFRCTSKAIYRITEEGQQVARWDNPGGSRGVTSHDSPNTSSTNLATHRPSMDNTVSETKTHVRTEPSHVGNDVKVQRRISTSEKASNVSYDSHDRPSQGQKESNADRLRYILDEPALRSLFREFLRSNFCEENLSFWLDVEDFKRKFSITSSANANINIRPMAGKHTPGQAAMEKHHESLIQTAFVIYNTYLAPSSSSELNIDHGLRNELVGYLTQVMTDLTGKAFQGRVDPEQGAALNATQLQAMIRLYDRIQAHVFRLMATDSVPKFIKTPKFMTLRNWVEDYDDNDTIITGNSSSNPALPPGLDDQAEVGRAYMTISPQANEKAQRIQQTLSHQAPSERPARTSS